MTIFICLSLGNKLCSDISSILSLTAFLFFISSHYTSLVTQLFCNSITFNLLCNKVEELRRDNKRKEILRAEQLKLQQDNIAMNVERSAHDLKNRNNRS